MRLQRRLVELEKLNSFRLASDEPDPRGWSIVACDGECVGIVQTLLIDPDRCKASHLVVQLDDAGVVLLPVALARLDAVEHRVIFDVSPRDAFMSLPGYAGHPPSEPEDRRIQELLIGETPVQPGHGASAERRQRDRRRNSNG